MSDLSDRFYAGFLVALGLVVLAFVVALFAETGVWFGEQTGAAYSGGGAVGIGFVIWAVGLFVVFLAFHTIGYIILDLPDAIREVFGDD